MSPATNKIKTDAIEAPSNQAEAEALLKEIGVLQRKVSGVENTMNDKMAVLKDKYEKEAQPLNDDIDTKFKALHVYAEANKSELLSKNSKTAKLSTGELIWRKSPPKVSVRDQDSVIVALRKHDLDDFIRTKEEVNKEAILADPDRVDGIKGITINSKEMFVAVPFESKIERSEPVKKTKTKR